jgi:uncharacterized membrane protein YfhO
MEKLDYIKTVFLSWWEDMHSKKKIIKNNWHKHITISVMFIMLFAPLLKLTFTMDEAIWFQYFVLLAVPLGLYWAFERVQGMYASYKGKSTPNPFESDKDVVASWVISSIVGVVIYTILLY